MHPPVFTTFSTRSTSTPGGRKTPKIPSNRMEETSGSNLPADSETPNAALEPRRIVFQEAHDPGRCCGPCLSCCPRHCASSGSAGATEFERGPGQSGLPLEFRKTGGVAPLGLARRSVAPGDRSERRRGKFPQCPESHGCWESDRNPCVADQAGELRSRPEVVPDRFLSRLRQEARAASPRGFAPGGSPFGR